MSLKITVFVSDKVPIMENGHIHMNKNGEYCRLMAKSVEDGESENYFTSDILPIKDLTEEKKRFFEKGVMDYVTLHPGEEGEPGVIIRLPLS